MLLYAGSQCACLPQVVLMVMCVSLEGAVRDREQLRCALTRHGEWCLEMDGEKKMLVWSADNYTFHLMVNTVALL